MVVDQLPSKHIELDSAAGPLVVNVLLVSSFVLPHVGGIEQFVDTVKDAMLARGWSVRVLACRLLETPTDADATVPTRFVLSGGWPLPVGGWRTMWREVGEADVVVVNGARHLLPSVAIFAARMRRRGALFVLHGSGAPFSNGSLLYHRVCGSAFEWMFTRPALRLSLPISLSRAGVAGARKRFGVAATHVPYPLRDLPEAELDRFLATDEPIKIVWVGRVYPEKDPLAAVAAVERVRHTREATLDVYGDGVLSGELTRLANDRSWLSVHGSRPWRTIQDVQARAHVCLSTSLRDATQIGILEPLSRGIPVVSTRVGDAPSYYIDPSLQTFCVEPRDVEATAAAILELAASHDRYRDAFAANGGLLRARHRHGRKSLLGLIETAATGAENGSRATPAPVVSGAKMNELRHQRVRGRSVPRSLGRRRE